MMTGHPLVARTGRPVKLRLLYVGMKIDTTREDDPFLNDLKSSRALGISQVLKTIYSESSIFVPK